MKKISMIVMIFALTVAIFAGRQAVAAEASDFIGTWKLKDTDHSSFNVTLKEDGSCTSTWGVGETGTWKLEGDRVTLSWTDGWHDILIKEKDGYKKLGFAPGVALTDPPSNSSVPEKV